MATNSKVFVSPGVYTSEVDLSFVAQSVGVTTLGIVGETIKGPAFEPIFVRNFDEFQTYFGGTSPEKFVNTQIPKYEAAYIAKAYLQQSNQLFVTRILGLSGYDAGPSWSILTKANLDPSTLDYLCLSGGTSPSNPCDPICVVKKQKTFSVDFSACTNGTLAFNLNGTKFPVEISSMFTEQYETFSGGVSNLDDNISDLVISVIASDNPYMAEDEYIKYFGSIPKEDYDFLTATGYTASTNVFGVDDVSFEDSNPSSGFNDPWYYALFDNIGNSQYSGFSFFTTITGVTFLNPSTTTTTTIAPTTTTTTTNPCVTPTPITTTTTTTPTVIDCYSGSVVGVLYYYTGTSFTQYDDLVVCTLRSRGLSTYSDEINPIYEVTGTTQVSWDMTGEYSGVLKNPFLPFEITATNNDGTVFNFVVSMNQSDANNINKVFGRGNFSKPRIQVPLMVEESYNTLLTYAWNKGYIRGLSSAIVSAEGAQGTDPLTIGWYLDKFQSPSTPWIVSELRGSKVYNLFKFYTISDGNTANTEVKISLADLSFNNETFTVLVRDYFDTDSNPVVLEKYTNCSMNPGENNYIAKKIGTLDGEYELKSKYIMVEINEDAPIDAIPCGFQGYRFREYPDGRSPFPIYKTKYFLPGEQVFNPPFGTTTGQDDAFVSAGDNIRKTYLGLGTYWGFDTDFFQYKGKVKPFDLCNGEGSDWNFVTKGFHMDQFASGITISGAFASSGTTAYEVGDTSFSSEPDNPENPYYRLNSRKFTVMVYGGFDGWDIYREYRTNADKFALGRTGFLNGACPSLRFPKGKGNGLFKQIAIGDGSIEFGNTDYYAYLLGQRTFANPEAVNINVFTTPGIDIQNNSDLVERAIDMIENERADSLYVATLPDYNMFVASTTEGDNLIYPQEAVDILEETGIDSNYTATYYPWVLTRDSVNNTQLYIPATAEVTRNLALTDNIAFPWFAAAGYTRGIVNSIKARKKLTQEDRDVLYLGRLNPIATFADVGTVIWGNKTLQVRESALDRINVRRLLLQARKLISAVSVRLLFDQNDQQVRQDFLNAVNPILDSIRRDRGLYDFRVTVSSDTEDLDKNQMVGKIYIKPTKSLEFIDITFYITPTGASFEDV
jgi:hypothetical protein